MLKITPVNGSDAAPMLKLEGKLLEPWVGEVLAACGQPTTRPSGLRLDLSGLTFVDTAGATLLRTLIRQGIAIAACSGFVAELLRLEKS